MMNPINPRTGRSVSEPDSCHAYNDARTEKMDAAGRNRTSKAAVEAASPALDKIRRERFRPSENGGWYAPRSAKLPIEDELNAVLQSMDYPASEVDRTKRLGEEHDEMVEQLRVARERLLELCARYPAEHARLDGHHRADGWKRPRHA